MCPSTSAANFCKTDMPASQRCGDSGTNQLDIDQSAYMALTGQAFGNVSTCEKEWERVGTNCFGEWNADGGCVIRGLRWRLPFRRRAARGIQAARLQLLRPRVRGARRRVRVLGGWLLRGRLLRGRLLRRLLRLRNRRWGWWAMRILALSFELGALKSEF